jgi:hypothetical protein
MANEGLTGLSEKLAAMGDINWAGMMMAGPALLSLGAGMMALSAGGLISGLLDGLGKLFGSDSPFDKLAMIGQNSKHIVEMSKEMRNMDGTLSKFEDSIDKIDADAISDKFYIISVAVRDLTSAVKDMGMGTILKLGLLNAVGGVGKTEASPAQKVGGVLPTPMSQGTSDVEGPGPNLYEQKRMRSNRRQALASGATAVDRAGNPIQVTQDAVPVVGQQNQAPQATTETTTTPPVTPNMKSDTEMMEADGISEKDLLQELIRLQTENNKLLKREMKAIEDNV